MKKNSLLLAIAALISFHFSAFANSRAVIVRTPESSVQDYKTYLNDSRQMSYLDWINYSLKKRTQASASLDSALEMANLRPLESLPLFDESLHQLQSDIMSEADRDLTLSILKKISSLDLPKKIQLEYLDRQQKFEEILQVNKTSKIQTDKNLMKRDFEKTRELIVKKYKMEDFDILIDGLPAQLTISRIQPQDQYQWTLISNSFEPFIKISTWNEFQNKVLTDDTLKPFARGECETAHLISGHFDLQIKTLVFSSSQCPPPSREMAHLSGINSEALRPEYRWKWIVPAIGILGVGMIYGLKDKHVTVLMPHF